MTKLNKIFEQDQILTHEELNAITRKVDDIIALLSSLDPGDSTIGDAQLQDKINTAKNELTDLLNGAILNVTLNLENLRNIVNSRTEVITELEWALYRAKVDQNTGRLASMIQLLEGEINIASLRDTVDDLNELIGSMSVSPGKLELVAGLFDENDNFVLPPASVIAAITQDDETGELVSEIAISAQRILVDGEFTLTDTLNGIDANLQTLNSSNATIRNTLTALNTTITGKANVSDLNAVWATLNNLNVPNTATINSLITGKLESNTGVFKGDVEAKSFKVMDGNIPSVVFTTMSDSYRGAGYENLNASGIINGEPIGLVYSNGEPKYFFDFAPVGNSNFSAEPTMFYNITGAASNITVSVANTYYYVTDSEDVNYNYYVESPHSNGTRVNNRTVYEYYDSQTAFATRAVSGNYIVRCYLYREVTFQNGTKSYTGKVRLLDSNNIGSNINSYIPLSTGTVYRDLIYDGDTTVAINLNSASYSGIKILSIGISNSAFTENNTNPFEVGVVETHSFGTNTGITNRNLLDPNLHIYQSA